MQRREAGFTFIEILVVMGIIVVLMGMVAVVVPRAQEAQRVTLSTRRVQQMATLLSERSMRKGWPSHSGKAFVLSLVIIAGGSALMVLRSRVEGVQQAFHEAIAPVPDSDRVFWAMVTGTLDFAKRTTRIVQNGSLPVYLMIILGVAALGAAQGNRVRVRTDGEMEEEGLEQIEVLFAKGFYEDAT